MKIHENLKRKTVEDELKESWTEVLKLPNEVKNQ